MSIDNFLDTLMQFYTWIYSQTGLKDWQLIIISLAVLFLLVRFLFYLRKARLREIHVIQKSVSSDIIGTNLSGSENTYRTKNKFWKKQAVSVPEEEEEPKSWGQTTREWRQLREKIRHLQHDIGKHERSEKHLKEQITELKSRNEKLQSEISKRMKIEEELKHQTNELITALFAQKQEEFFEDTVTCKTQHELKEIYKSPEFLEILQAKDLTEKTADSNEHRHRQVESLQNGQKTDQISTEQKIPVRYFQSQHAENKENCNPSDTTEKDNNLPLDIKELKAIADLVRRLQARSQDNQIK